MVRTKKLINIKLKKYRKTKKNNILKEKKNKLKFYDFSKIHHASILCI